MDDCLIMGLSIQKNSEVIYYFLLLGTNESKVECHCHCIWSSTVSVILRLPLHSYYSEVSLHTSLLELPFWRGWIDLVLVVLALTIPPWGGGESCWESGFVTESDGIAFGFSDTPHRAHPFKLCVQHECTVGSLEIWRKHHHHQKRWDLNLAILGSCLKLTSCFYKYTADKQCF